MPTLRPGQFFAHYEIEALVGRGGMGTVYRAHDHRLERTVAIKVLHRDGPEQERLRREAQALARLSHPHVVAVFEVGHHEGRGFVVMEFVAGVTLRQWLASEPRTVTEVLDVFTQAGHGLACAHASELVHRDFKPDNVLVGTDGRARVVDFGLVAYASTPHSKPLSPLPPQLDQLISQHSVDHIQPTGAAPLVGTLPYMPPEQIAGHSIGPWSDQFAFCASLYEALYGELPWDPDGLEREVAPPPRRTPAGILHRRVRHALMRGLADEPRRRFATMERLLASLSARKSLARSTGAPLLLSLAGASSLAWSLAAGDQTCDVAARRISQVWSGTQRAEVASSLERRDLVAYQAAFRRADTALSTYVRQWKVAYGDVCQRQEQEASATTDRALACLLNRERAAHAHVRNFKDFAQADVDDFLDATLALPSIDECVDEARVHDVDPEHRLAPPHLREGVAELLEQLEDVRAQLRLGLVKEPNAAALDLLEDAHELGYEPLVLDAAWEVADSWFQLQELGKAQSSFEEVYFRAQAFGAPQHAVVAAAHLNKIFARRRDFAAAYRWLQHARAALAHNDGHLADSVWLLVLEGDTLALQERYAAAADCYERARRHAHVLSAVAATDLDINLANVWGRLGRSEQALDLYERAYERETARVGADHPRLITFVANIGVLHFLRRNYGQAEVYFRRALELKARTWGADHWNLVRPHSNLAAALVKQGKLEEAKSTLYRALELASRARHEAEDEAVADAHLNLADILFKQGQGEEAIRHCHRALAAARSDDMLETAAQALRLIAEFECKRGQVDAAIRWFDEGMSRIEAARREHEPFAATMLFERAQCLHKSDRSAEALTSLDTAIAILEARHSRDGTALLAPLLFRYRLSGPRAGERDLARIREIADAGGALPTEIALEVSQLLEAHP